MDIGGWLLAKNDAREVISGSACNNMKGCFKMNRKYTAIMLALTLIFTSVLFGCENKDAASTLSPSQTQESAAPSTAASVETQPVEDDASVFPVTEETVFTMFISLPDSFAGKYETYADASLIKAMEEQTGVTMEITSPPADATGDLFNILIATEELPDLICMGDAYYTGGASVAVNNGAFANLYEYTEYFPNYMQAVEADETVEKTVINNDVIHSFYAIYYDPLPTEIIWARGDWLDAVGITELPETYEEYETMLRAFKTELDIKYPALLGQTGDISTGGPFLAGGYGITASFMTRPFVGVPWFVVGNEVRFGFMEDAYLEYVTMLNSWYTEGLINDNLASLGGGGFGQSYILSGETGVFSELITADETYGSMFTDENAYLVGLQNPVKNKGDTFKFGTSSPYFEAMWNINANCWNIPLLCQWVDYLYSEDGQLLANYGVENESFEYVNGVPTFTELITKNPDNLSPVNALVLYAGNRTPSIYDETRQLSFYTDGQKEIVERLSATITDEYVLPEAVTLNNEELEEYNAIMGDLLTYMEENFLSLIVGARPLSEFDDFRNELKEMGIERCIELYQAAYDRYLMG